MTGPCWHGEYHIVKDAYKVGKCPCGIDDGSMSIIFLDGKTVRECPHCGRCIIEQEAGEEGGQ